MAQISKPLRITSLMEAQENVREGPQVKKSRVKNRAYGHECLEIQPDEMERQLRRCVQTHVIDEVTQEIVPIEQAQFKKKGDYWQ